MKTIAKAEAPGLTKAQNAIQIAVLTAVSILTVCTLYMVPSWQVRVDPFLLAAVVGAVTVACLWLTRWLGSRATKFERTMLAGFLVGMPLAYVIGWFASRDHAVSSWIWVELVGLALFASFAALGLKNSPWFLAIGIAGHGFAWDFGTTGTRLISRIGTHLPACSWTWRSLPTWLRVSPDTERRSA